MRIPKLTPGARFVPPQTETGAWIGHIPFLHDLVSEMKPGVVVELGTHAGDSYFALCETVLQKKLETRCFAVDCWEGDAHSGKYDQSIFESVQQKNEAQYSSFSRLLKMRFDEALEKFEPQSIDLLHIDGFHTYEAVKHDFETWYEKVKPKGIILFHDIAERGRDFGVWKFWDELRSQGFANLSFHHFSGLGVLLNAREVVDFKNEFLNQIFSPGEEAIVEQYYRLCGERFDSVRHLAAIRNHQEHIRQLEAANEVLDKKLEATLLRRVKRRVKSLLPHGVGSSDAHP